LDYLYDFNNITNIALSTKIYAVFGLLFIDGGLLFLLYYFLKKSFALCSVIDKQMKLKKRPLGDEFDYLF
jgi:hypothetical protein